MLPSKRKRREPRESLDIKDSLKRLKLFLDPTTHLESRKTLRVLAVHEMVLEKDEHHLYPRNLLSCSKQLLQALAR